MKTPPLHLYKYFRPERSVVLDNWLIRFTQPKALNDPFEMRPHIAGYDTPDEVLKIAARRWEEHARESYDKLVNKHGKSKSFEEFRELIEPDRVAMIEEAIARSHEANSKMAEKIDELINKGVGVQWHYLKPIRYGYCAKESIRINPEDGHKAH